jgi:hypothetical protein
LEETFVTVFHLQNSGLTTKKPKVLDISTSNEGSDDINLSALFKDDPKHDTPVKQIPSPLNKKVDPNVQKLMDLLKEERKKKEAEKKAHLNVKTITSTPKPAFKPTDKITQHTRPHHTKVKAGQVLPTPTKSNGTITAIHPPHVHSANSTHSSNNVTAKSTPKATKNGKSNSSTSVGSVVVVIISYIIATKILN